MSENARKSLLSLRSQIESAVKYERIGCVLRHRQRNGNAPKPLLPSPPGVKLRQRLRQPTWDIQRVSAGLRGDGIERPYKLLVRETLDYEASSDAQIRSVDEFVELSGRCGTILRDIPEVLPSVFQHWPGIHSDTIVSYSPTDYWVAAVFEIAWQAIPASGLTATRLVKVGQYETDVESITSGISDVNCDSKVQESLESIVQHAGCPPTYWHSWIDDMRFASIASIDVIVSLTEMDKGKRVQESKPVCPVCENPDRSKVVMHKSGGLRKNRAGQRIQNWKCPRKGCSSTDQTLCD